MADFNVTYSEGKSRTATTWVLRTASWQEFVERCRLTKVTQETLDEYLRMDHDRQGDIKDVGGFVGAILRDNRRKKTNVVQRTMLTYDLDFEADPAQVRSGMEAAFPGTAWLMYSTHKSSQANPRMRLVVPLAAAVPPDCYEPTARMFAKRAGFIGMLDSTTFDVSRLFYWPSTPRDQEYTFHEAAGAPLRATDVLALYSPQDWRDASVWPLTGHEAAPQKLRDNRGGNVEDPMTKAGLPGAFCRAHSPITTAIAELLPGEYTQTGDRFTYVGATTHGGVVVYDNAEGVPCWVYSHHNTDPAGGELHNIFDLVRIHRFGHLDDGSRVKAEDRLPSYLAMLEFASNDPATKRQLFRDQMSEAEADFADLPCFDDSDGTETNEDQDDDAWAEGIERDKKGAPLVTLANLLYIYNNDPRLKGFVGNNQFTGAMTKRRKTPWSAATGRWTDADAAGLMTYLEKVYGIFHEKKAELALLQCATENAFHPVRDYFNSLKWDGQPRLERLFVDYLGAECTPLTRTMTRIAFTAAVARVFRPGTKFDYCTILQGPQGIGKSTILSIMGGEWFSDSIFTMEGKDAMEQLQGVLIAELGELASVKKSEAESTKIFLSKTVDVYRGAYRKYSNEHPRQCVFFGTTNEPTFLKGDYGNRRFWIIVCDKNERKKDVFNLHEERDQIWAEAVESYRQGCDLFLPKYLEDQVEKLQEEFNVTANDSYPGMLEAFLDIPIPVDYYNMTEEDRRAYFQAPEVNLGRKQVRTLFCFSDFMRERLFMTREDAGYRAIVNKLNIYMKSTSNWECIGKANKGGPYGKQVYFRRILNEISDDDFRD